MKNFAFCVTLSFSCLLSFSAFSCENEYVCRSDEILNINGGLQLTGILNGFNQRPPTVTARQNDRGIGQNFSKEVISLSMKFSEEKSRLRRNRYYYEANITGLNTFSDMGIETIGVGTSNPAKDIIKAGTNGIFELEKLKIAYTYEQDIQAINSRYDKLYHSAINNYFDSLDIDANDLAKKDPAAYNNHLDRINNLLSNTDDSALASMPTKVQESYKRRLNRLVESSKIETAKRTDTKLESLKQGQFDLSTQQEKLFDQHQDDVKKVMNEFAKQKQTLKSILSGQGQLQKTANTLLDTSKKNRKDIKNIDRNVGFLKATKINELTALEIDNMIRNGTLSKKDLVESGRIKSESDADYKTNIEDKAKVQEITAGMKSFSEGMAGLAALSSNLGMDPDFVAGMNTTAQVVGSASQIAMGASTGNPIAVINGLGGLSGAFGGKGKSAEEARFEALMAEHKRTQQMIKDLGIAMERGFKSIAQGIEQVIDNQITLSKQVTELTQITIQGLSDLKELHLQSLENQRYMIVGNYDKSCTDWLYCPDCNWNLAQSNYPIFLEEVSAKDFSYLACRDEIYKRYNTRNLNNPINNEFYLSFEQGASTSTTNSANRSKAIDQNYNLLTSYIIDKSPQFKVKNLNSVLSLLFIDGFNYDTVGAKYSFSETLADKTKELFREPKASLDAILFRQLNHVRVIESTETALEFLPFVELLGKDKTIKLPSKLSDFITQVKAHNQVTDKYVETILNRMHTHLRVDIAQQKLIAGDIFLPLFAQALTKTDEGDQEKHQVISILADNPVLALNVSRYIVISGLETTKYSALNYKSALSGNDRSSLQKALGLPNWPFQKATNKTKIPSIGLMAGDWFVAFEYPAKDSLGRDTKAIFSMKLPSPSAVNSRALILPPAYTESMDALKRVEDVILMRAVGKTASTEERKLLMALQYL